MRGRSALRRRRLVISCGGDRDQVRAVERMLDRQALLLRHQRRQRRRNHDASVVTA